jgi:hypothetical protein
VHKTLLLCKNAGQIALEFIERGVKFNDLSRVAICHVPAVSHHRKVQQQHQHSAKYMLSGDREIDGVAPQGCGLLQKRLAVCLSVCINSIWLVSRVNGQRALA